MAVDWDLLKAVRAALKADKDIPAGKIEELCRTIETQDQEIGQKAQEYASLHKQDQKLDIDLRAARADIDKLSARNVELQGEIDQLRVTLDTFDR